MKILTAMFRTRGDGTVTSHFRSQHMTGEDVLPMLLEIRNELNAEIALVETCPAVRSRYEEARSR